MNIEIRKNVPIPANRAGNTKGRGRKAIRITVAKLKIGESFKIGPYPTKKKAEGVRMLILGAARQERVETSQPLKVVTRISHSEEGTYVEAWRTV